MSKYLFPIEDQLQRPLASLAERITASSNFRMAWQWFATQDLDLTSAESIRSVISEIVSDPMCHQFLEPLSEPLITLMPHSHYRIIQSEDHFVDIIARAAMDHLGAYSRNLTAAPSGELENVRQAFTAPGPYLAFEVLPGTHAGCKDCMQSENHLFSNWFYGVAWDWYFVLTWPETKSLLVICLTDTD